MPHDERADDRVRRPVSLGRVAAASRWLGGLVALAGAAHLFGWISGFLGPLGIHIVTLKANAALSLLLLGAALVIRLVPGRHGVARSAASLLALVAVFIGTATLLENLFDLDFGIDQFVAVEPPGALGVAAPNRMGTPASAGVLLAGLAVLHLWRVTERGAVVAQRLALAVALIGLMSGIGYLYDVQALYRVLRLTAIALPTAVSLLVLAAALLCARPGEGVMRQVTAADPGGSVFRRLLAPMILVLLVTGWLRLQGERQGYFDPALGTALVIVLFIVMLTALLYVGARHVSRSSHALLEAQVERERLHEQVAAERERLQTALQRLPAGIVIAAAPSGEILYANDYAEHIFGHLRGVPSEQYAERWEPRHPDGTRVRRDEMPAARALRGETVSGEMVRFAREEGWVDLRVSAAPLRDGSGRVTQAVVTFEDVTARRLVEEALTRSEAQLRAVVENLAEGLVVAALDGRITHWNRAALRMHDFESAEEVRRHVAEFANVFELSTLEGAVLPHEQWPLPRILRGEAVQEWELRIRRLQGDWQRVFSYGGTLVRDEKGRPIVAVLTVQDITRRSEAEERRRRTALELAEAKRVADQARAQAEDASRAKDHFLSVLSHELRTPLSPILTGVSLLEREGSVSAQGRSVIDVVRRNVELEARLIDDLLDLTRITRGKVELDRRPLDLCTVVERAVEVCGADIEARGLQFGLDCGPRPLVVHADAARLQQVFWNLLKNAIKFTAKGGSVRVRCSEAERQVAVTVTDSGIGIEPSALPGIFDAFAQAERSITRQFGGLGLGLAISKALVELHGGTIEAASAGAGKGATFTVRLPLAAVAAADTAGHQPATTSREAPRRALRVLLVEDHGDTADMMKTMLELAGHEVRTAGDVGSALDAIDRDDRFDLVVSDLGLPDRSGLELMRELRSRHLALPAIALSGYGQERDIEQSRAAGFAAHLVKPAEPHVLLETMERVVRSAK